MESAFSYELPYGWLGGIYSRESETGNLLEHLCQPPALLGKKSSSISSAMPENTTSPAVMLGITAALSPMLCDPLYFREISAAPMTPLTLPSSCCTGTSSSPQGSGICPALFNHFVLDCPIPKSVRQDVLHRRFHSAGLCSQHRGGRGKPTMLLFDQVGRWQATGHCSLEIQRDTVHFWHPPVLTLPSSANWWWCGLLNRTPKILSFVLDTHFTFSPHACNCVEQA